MSYPGKFLGPDEQVVLDVRPHWKYMANPLFTVVVLMGGSVYALAAQLPRWAQLALAGTLATSLAWLVVRYFRWATTRFVVTSQRLISRHGVLSRTGREIMALKLTDVSYHQSLLDRVVGAGDLLIESPGRDGKEVFTDLPHPAAILAEISRVVAQWGSAGQ
ncbi:MAG: PH domain-containing protein [Acidimicrobiales bacterium]